MKKANTLEEVQNSISENQMVLLYFGAESCGVCQAVKPKISKVLEGYPHIKSIEVAVEKHRDIAAMYSIYTIPGILLYIEGKEFIREARYLSIGEIAEKIEKYYKLFYE